MPRKQIKVEVQDDPTIADILMQSRDDDEAMIIDPRVSLTPSIALAFPPSSSHTCHCYSRLRIDKPQPLSKIATIASHILPIWIHVGAKMLFSLPSGGE